MQIKLRSLTIRNFKGIINLLATFSLFGETHIFGRNEAGKTTIVDSWYWLLFGKDSLDRALFGIKNHVRTDLNRADHEVIGVLEYGGNEITLRKVYREKWDKKTGELEPSFSGHTTDYYYNGVPMAEKEYNAIVATWCKPEQFKLLANPSYFNTVLDWKQRRAVLLNIAGTISDDDIAQGNPDFLSLLEIVKGKRVTLDQYRKEVAVNIKDLKKEIEEVGPRIDEATRSLPKDQGEEAPIRRQITERTANLQQIDDLMEDRTKAFNQASQAQQEIQEQIFVAKRNLSEVKFKLEDALNAADRSSRSDMEQAAADIERLKGKLAKLKADLTVLQTREKEAGENRKNIRAAWEQLNAKPFEYPEFDEKDLKTHCPVCEQALQADKIEEHRIKLRSNYDKDRAQKETEFNTKTARELASFQHDGLAAKEKQEQALVDIATTQTQIQEIEVDIDARNTALDAMRAQYTAPAPLEQRLATAMQDSSEAIGISVLLEELQAKLKEVPQVDYSDLKEKKAAISSDIDVLNKKLGEIEASKKTLTRIEELKQQQRDLAQKLADCELLEHTIHAFKRAQDDELEHRINGKFRDVKFKLFNRQVNGTEEPTCETLHNGVPYSDLNTAGKVWAGLDIINTLQEHFNIRVPVFLDNRESTSNIPEMNCQVINMIVSPDDAELRIS